MVVGYHFIKITQNRTLNILLVPVYTAKQTGNGAERAGRGRTWKLLQGPAARASEPLARTWPVTPGLSPGPRASPLLWKPESSREAHKDGPGDEGRVPPRGLRADRKDKAASP